MSTSDSIASSAEETVHVALALDRDARERLAKKLLDAGLRVEFVGRTDELVAALPRCSWLLIGRPPRIDWGPAKRLRLLQVAGAGVDPLFPAVGLREAVIIANLGGVQADAVRDHAWSLLLAFARDLPRFAAQQSARVWAPRALEPLTGKQLVVLGVGAVGGRIALAGLAFGMSVRAVRRRSELPLPDGISLAEGPLGDVFAHADYVVVGLPSTRATRGLVDARCIERLPPHAVLVDVSRGGIVDHGAVEVALRSGRLRGAALDVFAEEPLPPSSSLWSCPNLIVTPHVAGFTPDYLERALDVFLENVARTRRGEPPRRAVSRELEY